MVPPLLDRFCDSSARYTRCSLSLEKLDATTRLILDSRPVFDFDVKSPYMGCRNVAVFGNDQSFIMTLAGSYVGSSKATPLKLLKYNLSSKFRRILI